MRAVLADLRKVDVNLLVVLDAILTEKNLTRAGECIGMTQPAVSGSLARLRQQFDDPILVRSGRGFELTAKGEELIPLVRQAMQEVSRTLELLPTFHAATSTRTFYLSASDYLLSQLTSPLLRLLAEHAPGVDVEFDSLPVGAAVTESDLLRRDLVVAGAGRGVPGARQSLFSDRFVCLAGANNPRLRAGRLSMTDLAELRHVRSSFGEGIVTHIDDLLAAAEISPRIGVSVQGFLPVPFVITGTSMIGFVPERVALQHLDDLQLVIPETPLPAATLVEAAFWHPSKSEDPAVKWLVKMLRHASELVEFGDDYEFLEPVGD
ncbi:LysR family transcriptional regulator [Okibacterium endophyticum]